MARIRRLVLRLLVTFLLVSIAQVLYVRFLPPLFTLTMLERKVEAARAGKPSDLKRSWVDLEDVSPQVVRAVLAGEDDRFYLHHGFDFTQIQRAWKANQKGRKVRGASTISQQTARNLFLWQKRSWIRKGLEAYYTVLLELLVPKDRILELYLNVAEWGERIFGIDAAARHYFKKAPKALSRTEAAALSASLPNPRKYPPTGSTRFQRRRQALILKRMNQPLGGQARPEAEKEDEEEEAEEEVQKGASSRAEPVTPVGPARIGTPSAPATSSSEEGQAVPSPASPGENDAAPTQDKPPPIVEPASDFPSP